MKKTFLLFLFLVIAIAAFLAVIIFTNRTEIINNKNTGQIAKTIECYKDADCLAGGCSGQLCLPRDKASQAFTTCEWQAEYACYAEDSCVCLNNKCQWSGTESFQNCLNNINK